MRYLWVFIVFSAAQAFGQNAYGPDFLNLHCTAPDPLAQVLFNIQPRPGLVPDHSANGNVVLYCDAPSGTFKASFNGGAYVSFGNALSNTFDVRISANSFDCTGTSAMDIGMQSIPSTAHIVVPFGCIVRLSSTHTYPQTFEFKQGGQLKPDTGKLITLTGPIIAGSYQIFSNAAVGQGGIDFTGNLNQFSIYPEWWGAVSEGSASVSTPAVQAAFYGAFGCNTSPVTSCRTNVSGLSQYNKRLELTGHYLLNAQINFYHVISFTIDCTGSGSIYGGLQQTATNTKILDGQSNAFGAFIGCTFSSGVSQDINHPLVDLNFDSSQGADLATEFISFYHNLWNGAGTTAIGFRVAAAGGTAQGSNINFYNNLAEGFTEAAYMIGSGSGCTPTHVATNAISINWYGGDIQSSPAYGIEDLGGANLMYRDGTMENGGFVGRGEAAQTGADFCTTAMNAGGGPLTVENYRSESAYMFGTGGGGGASFVATNALSLDLATVPSPGGFGAVGELIEGDVSCGHGLWEKVTASGSFSGLGSIGSPLTAASGTSTSITDSVGGFTVNAWTGWNVCILGGTGSSVPQYCTITSNTASTFTCSAGWQSDFLQANAATVVNPDNTTTYAIEPNWGTQTTSGGVTFAVDNTAYPGVFTVGGGFFPGKRFTIQNGGNNFNMQLTRADWATGSPIVDNTIYPGQNSVLVGSPATAGSGIGGLNVGNGISFLRTYTLPRNSITELSFPHRVDYGSRVFHFFSGHNGGGIAAADTYLGSDANLPANGQGDFFISNNSSNVQKKWTFNYDGTLTASTTPGSAAGYGIQLVSTAAISGFTNSAVPVKMDTSNANQIVITTTADTGAGIVVGVCSNAFNNISAGGSCFVIPSGFTSLTLGTGTCAIGQFVIVDTTTNGRVKCTSTYTAGTVIGVATIAQSTVGNTFAVMVGLR